MSSATSVAVIIANKLFDFDVLGLIVAIVLAFFGEQVMVPIVPTLASLTQGGQALFFVGFSAYVAALGAIAHASITVQTPAGSVSAQPGTPPSQ